MTRARATYPVAPRLDDTIVAISSPPGRAPRGLLRFSGSALMSLLGRLAHDGQSPDHHAPRATQRFDLNWSDGDPLPSLLTIHLGPRSYTGQDMAELQMPGNPILQEALVVRAVQAGARRAEPGEFTYRRFMAGKIDLTQAEGVAATIAAVSDIQLEAATRLRAGRLGSLVARLVGDLANALALVEAGIDFIDQEDVVPVTRPTLARQIDDLRRALHGLLERSVAWSRLDAPPRVTIVGRPSVGKSTLFNALVGRRRMVTAPGRGTTRDTVAEIIVLNSPHGRPFEAMLEDSPGLEAALVTLDRRVQATAERAMREADLVLLADDGCPPDWAELGVDVERVVRVRTKVDLGHVEETDADVVLSVYTGEGLDALRRLIADRLSGRAVSIDGAAMVLQRRHAEHLHAAREHLDAARDLISGEQGDTLNSPEIVAAAMRSALDELALLAGVVTPDDVIGRVFATFCVGK